MKEDSILEEFFSEVQQVEDEVKKESEISIDRSLTGSFVGSIVEKERPKDSKLCYPPKHVHAGSTGVIVITKEPSISLPEVIVSSPSFESRSKNRNDINVQKVAYSGLNCNKTGAQLSSPLPENLHTMDTYRSLPRVIPMSTSSLIKSEEKDQIQQNRKSVKRTAAGQSWEDPTLMAFPLNDFRLFVGNLAKDITDSKLTEAFSSRYSSFAMARVCYNSSTNTSNGYGFVSLMDYKDCAKAIREMDQTWIGSRPIKVKRSEWKDRNLFEIKKKKKKWISRGLRKL